MPILSSYVHIGFENVTSEVQAEDIRAPLNETWHNLCFLARSTNSLSERSSPWLPGEGHIGTALFLEGMLAFCSQHLNAYTFDPTIFLKQTCPVETLKCVCANVGVNNFGFDTHRGTVETSPNVWSWEAH